MELREERDFGQKFNAVFTFVQTNFKSFFKVIGLTVGPLALIGGFFFGLVYSNIFGSMGSVMNNINPEDPLRLSMNNPMLSWGANLIFSYFFLGVASLWMMIAVYAFMAEYDRGNENITIEAVWKRGKDKIMPTIGLGILMILAMVFFVGIILALPMNNALAIFFKAVILIVGLFYVLFPLSLVVPNMVIDDAGVFESIGRSFALIRGKWWSTFGLLTVMSFISSFASLIFAIPLYVGMVINLLMRTGAGETLTVVGSCIYFLGSFLLTSLPMLAIGFQYFNLVERKEGTGLLRKMDMIGKPEPV